MYRCGRALKCTSCHLGCPCMKPDCLIDSLSRLLTSVSTYSITMLCLCIMHIVFTVHVSISKTDNSRLDRRYFD